MPAMRNVLQGETYGRLTTLQEVLPRQGKRRFIVRCSCSKVLTVLLNNMVTGTTQSCGCLALEVRTKHGMSNTKTYQVWADMLARSSNPKHRQHSDYLGRGITVCENWQKFENFYADMGEAPEGLSLDRVDNDGGYCRENCRWSTATEQQRNKQRKIAPQAGVTALPNGMYRSRITVADKTISLGYNLSYEDAIRLRLSAEKKLWGTEPDLRQV